jgi:hypothetical protein
MEKFDEEDEDLDSVIGTNHSAAKVGDDSVMMMMT